MTQTNELIEIVRGSGNVFAEFGHPGALAEQVKASLAAEIIKAMDAQALNARQAEGRTGITASDFSRIRHVKLDHFTIDRLLTILERLDNQVEVQMAVTIVPHRSGAAAPALS